MVEGRQDVPPDASDGRGGEDGPRLTRHPLDPGTERRGGAGGVSCATRRCVGCGVEDYDSLLFGAPRMVRFLAISSTEFLPSQGRSRTVSPEVLDLAENLEHLGLTREQLVDVAILVGTDFNEGVRGIGPKTAVKRIREWRSLDQAPGEISAVLPSTVDAIRAFFLNPPVSTEKVPR